jgi:hypothetical protein
LGDDSLKGGLPRGIPRYDYGCGKSLNHPETQDKGSFGSVQKLPFFLGERRKHPPNTEKKECFAQTRKRKKGVGVETFSSGMRK